MTSKIFQLRFKMKEGSFILDSLDEASTIEDMKACIFSFTSISYDCLKILYGYPRKELDMTDDSAKLSSFNISSGETLIIEKKKVNGLNHDDFKVTELGDNQAGSAVLVVQPDDAPVMMQTEDASVMRQPDVAPPVMMQPNDAPVMMQPNDAPVMQPEDAPVIMVQPEDAAAEPQVPEDLTPQPGILLRHVVPANNNCLFSSIYFVMSGGDTDLNPATELRQIVANAIVIDPIRFNEGMLCMKNRAYYNWILDASHWGGAIELTILSEYYEIEIVAIDTKSLTFHRFGETKNYENCIFLIYDGIHYDALVMETSDGIITVFSTEDKKVVELATEVAREAHASRQYTDMANCTLKCMVCKIGLHGDKEAREHAMATKHIEFGEM